ncbi:uncharacterized protein LOC144347248 [Saccoglossus kowalevskii]
MASSVIQLPDITVESKSRIIELANRELGSGSGVPTLPLSLEDSQRRWLIVGLCLHNVISPLLRKHVDTELQSVYSSIKSSHNIDQQQYPRQLKTYPPKKGYSLEYKNINKNKKNNVQQYNYKITSHVDFAKLFLQTHMAKFTALDDTCDSSALLGLICNVSCFSPTLKTAAQQVRDVRNKWAHCNFTVWDGLLYSTCFSNMETLIRAMYLSTSDESEALGNLQDWESKGNVLKFRFSLSMQRQF